MHPVMSEMLASEERYGAELETVLADVAVACAESKAVSAADAKSITWRLSACLAASKVLQRTLRKNSGAPAPSAVLVKHALPHLPEIEAFVKAYQESVQPVLARLAGKRADRAKKTEVAALIKRVGLPITRPSHWRHAVQTASSTWSAKQHPAERPDPHSAAGRPSAPPPLPCLLPPSSACQPQQLLPLPNRRNIIDMGLLSRQLTQEHDRAAAGLGGRRSSIPVVATHKEKSAPFGCSTSDRVDLNGTVRYEETEAEEVKSRGLFVARLDSFICELTNHVFRDVNVRTVRTTFGTGLIPLPADAGREKRSASFSCFVASPVHPLELPDQVQLLHHGSLTKAYSRGRHVRWFALLSDRLVHCKPEHASNLVSASAFSPKNALLLANVVEVECGPDELTSSGAAHAASTLPYAFRIHSEPGGTPLVLSAETADERDYWILQLRQAVADQQPSGGFGGPRSRFRRESAALPLFPAGGSPAGGGERGGKSLFRHTKHMLQACHATPLSSPPSPGLTPTQSPDQ
eukprot:gene11168-17172_t